MKLSIIISCYNVSYWIRSTITSLIKQSKEHDVEIIAINDGSTDETLTILENYTCEKLRIISHSQNRGLIDTRNTGLKNAKGDYLWFIDSDDIIPENALDIIFYELSRNQVDVLNFDFQRIHKKNKFEHITYKCKYNHNYNGQYIYAKKNIHSYVWNKVINKAFLMKHDIKFDMIPDDEYLLLQICKKAQTYRFIPHVIYQYRVHPHSDSQLIGTQSQYYKGYFKILEEYYREQEEIIFRPFIETITLKCIKGIIINFNKVKSIDKQKISDDRKTYYKKLQKHIKLIFTQHPIKTSKGLLCKITYYIPFLPDTIYRLYKFFKNIVS
ncbi:MAG: glycosyltransferase [Bacteroides sp.]|nr:glycosyltransferase [Bacteroides sp.]